MINIYTFSAYNCYAYIIFHVMFPCVSILVVSFCVMFLLIASTPVHVMQVLRLGPHEPPSVHSLEELPLVAAETFWNWFQTGFR